MLAGRAACRTRRGRMGNPYLVAAYVFTAVLFGLYAWSIVRRKARARREIESLNKNRTGQ